MKKLAILVGGGPAPGINAVIAAATIEARNRGLQVLGCYHGFRWLVQGDTQHIVELDIGDVSRIHFEGGSILLTSRTNPTRSPEGVRRVAETLQRLGVQYLLTLGGDDTALRKLFGDESESCPRRPTNPKGQMPRVPTHDSDKKPPFGGHGILHEVTNQVLTEIAGRGETKSDNVCG